MWDSLAELPWQQAVSRRGTKRKRLTDRDLQPDAACASSHATRSALCARPAQLSVFPARVLLATHAASNATAHAGRMRATTKTATETYLQCMSAAPWPAPYRPDRLMLRRLHTPHTHPHVHGPLSHWFLGRFLLTNLLLLQTPTPPYPAMATVPYVPGPTLRV